jgi:hypothetical protein
LNLFIRPNHFERFSPSLNSELRFYIETRISIKLPMIYEKIATPPKRIKAQRALSELEVGKKSPNPTVLKVVKA